MCHIFILQLTEKQSNQFSFVCLFVYCITAKNDRKNEHMIGADWVVHTVDGSDDSAVTRFKINCRNFGF